MKINEFFEKEYLVAGNTYDNFIFENCPNEFLKLAKQKIIKSNGEVKPCVVYLNKEQEELLEKILNNFSEEYHKKVLARDFITAMVMKELLKYKTQEHNSKEFVSQQITAFYQNNIEKVKGLHCKSFMPYDVNKIAKSLGKIELTFILEGTKNIYLQQAINVFVSSREPYSVKIITNNKNLATYYDLDGNIIECPHDFMRRDVNRFIEQSNFVEK